MPDLLLSYHGPWMHGYTDHADQGGLPGATGTSLVDINDRGQIAGFTLDDPVTLAGARRFLLAKGAKGPFTPIDVPGAPRNLVRGLNDRGQLVGSYEDPDAVRARHPGRCRLAGWHDHWRR